MEKYKKEKCIGKGTFGIVWLVKSTLSKMPYVLKTINLYSLTKEERNRAFNECVILSKFEHTNIIGYKDAFVENDIGRLSIIMEYADGGDLYTTIRNQYGIPFKENVVLSWFTQISLAIQYIHYRNVLHRDLKTQNVFLMKSNIIKIGDFGIAKVLRNTGDLATTSIGTPYYLSPEICARKPYNSKSDMWALGCILYEIVALDFPYKASNFPTLVDQILHGKPNPIPDWSSNEIQEMITDLLMYDPTKRPSVDELLKYPCLQPYLSSYFYERGSPKAISDFVEVQKPTGVEYQKQIVPASYLTRRASSNSPRSAKRATPLKNEDSSGRNRTASNQAAHSTSRLMTPTSEVMRSNKHSNVFKTPNSTSNISKSSNKLSKTRAVPASTHPDKSVLKSPSSRVNQSLVYKTPTSSHEMLKSANGDLNITYLVPDKEVSTKNINQKSHSVLSKGIMSDGDGDCGYQSAEVSLNTSDEKQRSSANWNKNFEEYGKQSITTKSPKPTGLEYKKNAALKKNEHSKDTYIEWDKVLEHECKAVQNVSYFFNIEDESDEMAATPAQSENQYDLNPGNESFSSNCSIHSSFTVGANCQHQCYQCMLYTLWKNRIRDSSGNVDSSRLRRKLVSVFKNDFEKVYDSLLYDYGGNERGESRNSIREIMETLNYQQMNVLPLMMQLVQLEYHQNNLVKDLHDEIECKEKD